MARLDDAAISAGLADLHWLRDGDELTKTVKLGDFSAALAFVNAVGALAEAANHHPDIDIRWNTVMLRLTTHDAGGLTVKDLQLAAAIDALGGRDRLSRVVRARARRLGNTTAELPSPCRGRRAPAYPHLVPASELVEVTVDSVAAGGDGLARLPDGMVVFCEGGLPGERVAVAIRERRRDYARATVVEVLAASPARVAPPCPHVLGGCGGCPWQHVAVADGAALKRTIITDALRRIAHLDGVEVTSAPEAIPLRGYRTSARPAVQPDGTPAYHRRHGRGLVGVDSCLVAHPLVEELLTGPRFPGATQVMLRVGAGTGERLAWPDRRSGPATVPSGTALGPRAVIHEDVGGRRWRVAATSFFQSGPQAGEALIAAVGRAAGAVAEGATVVDLYAGVGLLGGALAARSGARLIAVESNAAAAADAGANLADLEAQVITGEVAQVGGTARLLRSRPAVVVADPARTGLGPSASAAVAAIAAPVVVLVSCDPASFGRDARLLDAAGYRLTTVEVLDLFPGTVHIEAVSRFVASGEPATPG